MIRGFVFALPEHPLHLARIGESIQHAKRGPPWMVVDHALSTVIITGWPGRLLAVEVTDAVTEQDLADVKQHPLRADAGYTRAVAVRVLEEVPAERLFGAHGGAVVEIIERAQRLSRQDAEALASAGDPAAERAYSDAWDRWLVAEGRGDSPHAGGEHRGTLLIPARDRAGSPIHSGFTVVSSQLHKRAREITGSAAFLVDEDGDVSLASPWCEAADALLYAAMARGAPELVSEQERGSLLRAWRALTGEP